LYKCRRADDEDDDEPGVQFFTHGNDFLHDFSDTESVSVSTPHDINRSLTPSPLESPTWMVKQNDSSPISRKNGRFSPDSPGYGTKASLGSDGSPQQINGSVTDSGDGSKTQYPVEFGANIWCPPPPEDEGDDIESRLFGFQDEDDEAGDSSGLLVSGSFSANKIAAIDEVTNTAQEECLKTAVLGHFRALVAQLLKAEGIDMGKDDGSKGWLDIVSSLTWQAASYVRPDTKKGGSMDPTDYVKVKCIASGDPRDRFVFFRLKFTWLLSLPCKTD
jgi:1-phosphatidylinositol-3-phosphate 5-kinase